MDIQSVKLQNISLDSLEKELASILEILEQQKDLVTLIDQMIEDENNYKES